MVYMETNSLEAETLEAGSSTFSSPISNLWCICMMYFELNSEAKIQLMHGHLQINSTQLTMCTCALWKKGDISSS